MDSFRCKDCNTNIINHIIYLSKDHITNKEPLFCPACIINKINPYENNEKILCTLFIDKYKKKIKNSLRLCSSFMIDKKILMDIKQNSTKGIYMYCLESNKIINSMNKFKLPSSFFVNINNSKIILENKLNIDLSSVISESNTIEINHAYISNPICIIILERSLKSVFDLKSEIKFTYEECYDKIINNFSSQMISKEKFTINCVYSNKIITMPVRGINCKHFNCFDFLTYIKINKFRRRFECPICKQISFICDLYEDKYFSEILKKCSQMESVDDYDFYIDGKGTWEAIKKTKDVQQNFYKSFDENSCRIIEELNY